MSEEGSQNSSIRGIIFDFDGVLIDSESIAHIAWTEAIKSAGKPLNKEEQEELYHVGLGMSTDMMLEWLKGRHGFEVDEAFHTDLERRFNEKFDADALIPDADTTLQLLQKHAVPIALATNSRAAEMHFKLQKVGLARFFQERAFNPEDVNGKAKPAPDLYIHAARALGLEPQQCLVIEDSLLGLRAAISAGASAWGLGLSHSPEQVQQMLELGASRVVYSHKELQAALAEELLWQ